jgi:hypothetical protein
MAQETDPDHSLDSVLDSVLDVCTTAQQALNSDDGMQPQYWHNKPVPKTDNLDTKIELTTVRTPTKTERAPKRVMVAEPMDTDDHVSIMDRKTRDSVVQE